MQTERKKKTKTLGVALIVIGLIIAVAGPTLFYLTVQLPADIAYQNTFGANVLLSYQQPDFNGTAYYVTLVWQTMNQTWPCQGPPNDPCLNQKTIYNSWYPWDRTLDNSIYEENVYFHHLLYIRIPQLYAQWQAIQSGKQVLISTADPMTALIQGLRNEMNSSGGIDWAIQGAFYLDFYPMAYFAIWFYAVFIVVGAAFVIVGWARLPRDYY